MAKIKVYQAKEENMDAVKISLMLRNKTQLLKIYKIYMRVY